MHNMHLQLQQMDQALSHISQVNQLKQKQIFFEKGRHTMVSKTKLKDEATSTEEVARKSIQTDRRHEPTDNNSSEYVITRGVLKTDEDSKQVAPRLAKQ